VGGAVRSRVYYAILDQRSAHHPGVDSGGYTRLLGAPVSCNFSNALIGNTVFCWLKPYLELLS
ncbi:hypothetical protein GCK32_007784, partial [Trichostrongylus colubriformis]